jgi:Mn2+/Fe2+ NRAMP family transporter
MSRQNTIAEARWADRFDWVRWLGPGFVMAATAIGASHLVLAPTAGALYGYSLLWLVMFAHVFKYPAFDFGPRYAVATNSTLLDGYARVPGPRNWALWTFLLGTVVQGVTVLAGVLSVAAVVARAVVPELSLVAWSAGIAGLGAVVLWSGRFSGLSAASKAMLTVLAIMTAIAFFARPPSPAIVIELVRPHLPIGSLVLAAAMLGWMPTGLDVSVWHSMWALERCDTWAERAGPGPEQKRGVLAIALTDLRLGYGLSFVLAVMFLALGVAVLKPTGSVPQGGQVAVTIARLYTDVLGGWALYPFLIAAFFGMTSTSFGVLDGFPRAFSGCVRRIALEPPSERSLFWGFLVFIVVLAMLEIALLPDPVVLVTIAAVASFLLSPLTYALNYYCVTRHIEQPNLQPGNFLRRWALFGIACATAAAGLFLGVRF